jgi:hypothetical protein
MKLKSLLALTLFGLSSVAHAGYIVYGFSGVIDPYYGNENAAITGTLTVQSERPVRGTPGHISFSSYSGCYSIRDGRCESWERPEVQEPVISKVTLNAAFGSYIYTLSSRGLETGTVVSQDVVGGGATTVAYEVSQMQNRYRGNDLVSSTIQSIQLLFPENGSPLLTQGDLTTPPDLRYGLGSFFAMDSHCTMVLKQCTYSPSDYAISGRLTEFYEIARGVPEPGSTALLGAGLIAWLFRRRKRYQ